MAGGEIVRAVEDDAARGDQGVELLALQPLLEGNDLHFRVDFRERLAPGRSFGSSYRVGGVKDLALQVGEIHRVAVCKCDRPDACRREIQRRGWAYPSRADDHRRS